MLRAIGVYSASSYAPDALAQLGDIPASAEDDTSREWHVRAAIAAQDWKAALHALQDMSETQKADARWRYLRARTLVKLDREHEAEPIFASVAQEARVHGFLAADWINQPYSICSSALSATSDDEKIVRDNASLQRAFEFFALDRLSEARHESGLRPRQTRPARSPPCRRPGEQTRLVRSCRLLPSTRATICIFTICASRSRGAIRSNAMRVPRESIRPGPTPSSAPKARGRPTHIPAPVRRYGLMQLLPGTAKQLAKAEKVAFSGAANLFDPVLNIRLGTRYLSDMAMRYDGSAWLASAAYNAGVDPVGRWVNARDSLEPDFFIETIPYKETREYVARVLAFSVIYDWRMHGNAQSLTSKMTRIGQSYAPPGDDAPRKSVVCPSTPAPSRAVTESTPAPKTQVSQQTAP